MTHFIALQLNSTSNISGNTGLHAKAWQKKITAIIKIHCCEN